MKIFKTMSVVQLQAILNTLTHLERLGEQSSNVVSVMLDTDCGRIMINNDKGTKHLLDKLIMEAVNRLEEVTDETILKEFEICLYSIFIETAYENDPMLDGIIDGVVYGNFADVGGTYIIPHTAIVSDERRGEACKTSFTMEPGLRNEDISTLIRHDGILYQRTKSGCAYIYRDISNGEIWIG